MNILFTILKIISLGWVAFMGFGIWASAYSGEGSVPAFIFIIMASPAIIFLVWRFNVDKVKKQEKKAIKKKQQEQENNKKQEIKLQKEKVKQEEIDKLHTIEFIEDKKIYRFKVNEFATNVITEGNWITIERKKGALHYSSLGSKKIHFKNITGVEYNKGAYIEIHMNSYNNNSRDKSVGEVLLGVKPLDENRILISKKDIEIAEKLVAEIESKIEQLHSLSIQNKPIQTIAQQIKEFKDLLDEGIITQEEFDKKKSELLK